MNRSIVMKGLAVMVSIAVVASLAGAAYVLGSPAQRRQIRLDDRRLEDLGDIASAVRRYVRKYHALPQDLAALQKQMEETSNSPLPTDPDTRAPYEYKALDVQSYQLCAVFSLPSPNYSYYEYARRTHDAGKQCFKYNVCEDDDDDKCRLTGKTGVNPPASALAHP